MRCAVCGCDDGEHELIEPGEAPGACTACGCPAFVPDPGPVDGWDEDTADALGWDPFDPDAGYQRPEVTVWPSPTYL